MYSADPQRNWRTIPTFPTARFGVLGPAISAVGFARADTSGPALPRHAEAIQRHAEKLGYRYVCGVRPPDDHPDPIGYALTIAIDVQAAAIVVHDLTTVDHSPARVCEICDLETVDPPQTWAAVSPGPAHTFPGYPLTITESHRIMQQHRSCRAVRCHRKATALTRLVHAGILVPPTISPRERAAARGLPFPPLDSELPVTPGADLPTLLAVLDGLTAPGLTTGPDDGPG